MTFPDAVGLAAELIHELAACRANPRGCSWDELDPDSRKKIQMDVSEVFLTRPSLEKLFPDPQSQCVIRTFKRLCFWS